MFIEYLAKDQRYFFAMLITIVLSVCLHELAHGVVAIWLGDRTPIEEGHMTLNPLVHMGPISLICLLLAGIAWGAMPVNPHRLRGKYAPALVAAAGPLMNVLLALLALTALGLWTRADPRSEEEVGQAVSNARFLLGTFGLANILLAIFNLLPVPPLDGSHILENFSRSFADTANRMTRYSPMLFLLVFAVAGRFLWPVAETITSRFLLLVRGF